MIKKLTDTDITRLCGPDKIDYIGRIQDLHNTLEGVGDKEINLVTDLFDKNPFVRRRARNKLGFTIIDLADIPEKFTDLDIIQYVASEINTRHEESLSIKDRDTTYNNPNIIWDHKNNRIHGFNTKAIETINESVMYAIDLYFNELKTPSFGKDEFLEMIAPGYTNLKKILLEDTRAILRFIKKDFINENSNLSDTAKKYWKMVTCSILKLALAKIDSEQYKQELEKSASIFHDYVRGGELTDGLFQRSDIKNPIEDKSNPDYFKDKKYRLTRSEMRKIGIQYDRDIEFKILVREKTQLSNIKKSVFDQNQSGKTTSFDQGGIRDFILGKKNCEEIKNDAVILFYRRLKRIVDNHMQFNDKIRKNFPHGNNGKYTLEEYHNIVSLIGGVTKDKNSLKLVVRQKEDKSKNQALQYNIDQDFYDSHNCTDPIVMQFLQLTVDSINQELQATFENKNKTEAERKYNLLKKIVTDYDESISEAGLDMIMTLVKTYKSHDSRSKKISLQDRKKMLMNMQKIKNIKEEHLSENGIEYRKIEGKRMIVRYTERKGHDTIYEVKDTQHNKGIKFSYKYDELKNEYLAIGTQGDRTIELNIDTIILWAEEFLEKWQQEKKSHKQTEKIGRKDQSSEHWMDVRYAGPIYNSYYPFYGEHQVTTEAAIRSMPAIAVNELYAPRKNMECLRRCEFIMSVEEIKQYTEESLLPMLGSCQEAQNMMTGKEIIQELEKKGDFTNVFTAEVVNGREPLPGTNNTFVTTKKINRLQNHGLIPE